MVWQDWGVSGTGYYYSRYIRAARVSPSGIVLDQPPIEVFASGASSSGMFAAASDGNNWAVVFQGSSSGESDIVGVRIGPDGTRLDLAPVTIVPASYYLRFDLRLAFAGGIYLLAWEDLDALQGQILGADLEPLAAPFTVAAGNDGSVQLGSDGAGFFAVWTATQADFIAAVIGSRIDPSGALLDPGGINISRANAPEAYAALPQAGWDGTNWRVTWAHAGLAVARVASDGAVLDPGAVVVPASGTGPQALAPGGRMVMVWDGNGPQSQSLDVFGVAIGADFGAGTEQILSLGAPSQTHADAAAGGDGWLLVYRSATSSRWAILAQPLDAGGAPLGGPVELDHGDTVTGPTDPAVAWNGAVFLATWSHGDAGGILARRLFADGAPVEAAPFAVMPGTSPDAAALGDVFLVVGTDQTIGPHFVHPFAMRVSGADGALLDPERVLLGQYFARWPAVAALGGRWLAVWQRNVSHDNPRAELDAALVAADGAATPAFVIDTLLTGSRYTGPQLAAAGADWALLTWEDERISTVETEVVGQFMFGDGTLADAVTVTAQPGNQFRTDVAWDGDRFVIAYQDQRNLTSELETLDARSDLFATRVDVDGAVIDPAGFAFAATAGGDIYPTVAAANGVSLIAGAVMRAEAPYAAYRVGYELLGVGANQPPVVAATALPDAGETPLAVTFDPTGSVDADGTIVAYDWDFGDGATSQEVAPVHTYEAPGFPVASLTVSDDRGAASSTTVLIEASAPNLPPVAVASAEPSSGPAPLDVVFGASGSYDPDGGLGNIHWDFGDGWDYWGTPAYHTFTAPGSYPVALTVWDADGATATASVTVTVEGGDSEPPTVRFLAPSNLAVVADSLVVAVAARDNVGIRGIVVLLDGQPVCTSQTSPLTCSRSAKDRAPGPHRLDARSIDAAGNVGGAALVVLFPPSG